MPAVVLGSSIHMFIRCWFLLTLLEVVTRNYFNSPANFLSVCPFSFHKYLKNFLLTPLMNDGLNFSIIFSLYYFVQAHRYTLLQNSQKMFDYLCGENCLMIQGFFHFSFHATYFIFPLMNPWSVAEFTWSTYGSVSTLQMTHDKFFLHFQLRFSKK